MKPWSLAAGRAAGAGGASATTTTSMRPITSLGDSGTRAAGWDRDGKPGSGGVARPAVGSSVAVWCGAAVGAATVSWGEGAAGDGAAVAMTSTAAAGGCVLSSVGMGCDATAACRGGGPASRAVPRWGVGAVIAGAARAVAAAATGVTIGGVARSDTGSDTAAAAGTPSSGAAGRFTGMAVVMCRRSAALATGTVALLAGSVRGGGSTAMKEEVSEGGAPRPGGPLKVSLRSLTGFSFPLVISVGAVISREPSFRISGVIPTD